MKLALVLLLVACGGGSEKPPVAPQPPPDAAVALVDEPPPVEADGADPQALPPADIADQRGLMRKPRPAPPAPPPASLAGYPPNCVLYMNAFLKLAQCDKLAADESMMGGYRATLEAWNEMAASAPSPEVMQAWDDGCKAGHEALVQTAPAMGCDL